MLAVYYLYKIFCTTYSIVNIEKYEIRVYLVSALFYFVSGLLLILFFMGKGEECRRLIERVDGFIHRLTNSGLGREEEFEHMYWLAARRLGRFTYFMTASAFACPLMFSISVPLIDFIHGAYRTRTAVPAQCPFELTIQQIPGVFEFIVIQQGMAYTIPSLQKIVSEVIMLSLFNIQSSTFRYLSITIHVIAEEMTSSSSNKKIALKKFPIWIKLHQDSISLFEDIITLFSPLVVTYYLITIVSVAGSLLYMVEASDANILQSLFGGGYMIMTMLSLLLQCQAADEATTEAQNIVNEVYNLPWYILDAKTNFYIVCILQMATKPIFVDAYRSPAFRLCNESYRALVMNTVSAYMGFRKLMDMNKT